MKLSKIYNDMGNLSDEDASKSMRGAMEAAHLDDTIPCPICDRELYIRTYEKIDSMCDFGDE